MVRSDVEEQPEQIQKKRCYIDLTAGNGGQKNKSVRMIYHERTDEKGNNQ